MKKKNVRREKIISKTFILSPLIRLMQDACFGSILLIVYIVPIKYGASRGDPVKALSSFPLFFFFGD